MSDVVKNYRGIISQISKLHKEYSQTSKNPKLIAVSKTFPEEVIKKVIEDGHKIFGENKVQEAFSKWKSLKNNYDHLELHLIGPLQSNKVKIALEIFDVIQTIDRARSYKFFIQVNIGNEEQKSGVKISDLSDFIEWTVKDQKLKVDGLMCIPPYDEDPSLYFNLLRQLCDNHNLQHASMGMTNDFEKAVKFGATYLRVGSGIFGKRS